MSFLITTSAKDYYTNHLAHIGDKVSFLDIENSIFVTLVEDDIQTIEVRTTMSVFTALQERKCQP